MHAIDFTKARYAAAAHYPRQWPGDQGAEIAFAGRSNVGKSSVINTITRQNRLAKTSKTPGRTQQIVFFDLGMAFRLVDLPGYGYAKVPEKLRRHWRTFIRHYLLHRQCLRLLVIAMDIRRPLTDIDLVMLQYCREIELPAHILLTKADKFKRGRAVNVLRQVTQHIQSDPRTTTVQLFSALTRQGVEEARTRLANSLYS